MSKQTEDRSMKRVRKAIEKSGLNQQELGEKMGYDKQTARKAVWQFLRTTDPRIGMLRKFAKAMGLDVNDLI